MHVAIDITPLHTGHKDRGVGTYTKLLIEALQKYERKHSYSFFTRGQKVSDSVDLVHYPYFDPFFLTLPLLKPKPTVVTVHDLIPLVFPDKFPSGIKGFLKWQLQKFSLKSAKRIIAVSEQSKMDIHQFGRFPNDSIDVILSAPAPIFEVMPNKKKLEKMKRKYKLPDRFVLYVGDVNWNKNIIGMLKAFSIVKSLKSKVTLVLAGKAFNDRSLTEVKEINDLIHSLKITKDVRKLGFVPDVDLVGIYNLATVYVQPSFYEGFGLPVLEAMACGCPVVCSYASSLKEIGGPAISVDPNDFNNIASGIIDVLNLTDDERIKLQRDGLAWAKRFHWKIVAAQTVASYEKALA